MSLRSLRFTVSSAGLLLGFSALLNCGVVSGQLLSENKSVSTASKIGADDSSDEAVQLIYGDEGKILLRGVQTAHRVLIAERIAKDKPITEFLSVFVGKPTDDAQPMLGRFEIRQETIIFVSRFGLSRSDSYTVRVQLPAIGDQKPVVKDYLIQGSSKPAIREAEVTAIYPSSDVLPDNLLKFYIHFSKPMSRGEVYEHIELIDGDTGVKVEQPFLEIQQELWTADQTRLMLLFDPGRIKRGLRPREEIGPPLVPGKKYVLRIKESWKDAENQRLVASYEKHFKVVESDHVQPSIQNWKLKIPEANSFEPLRIDFDESLDHAMLTHSITVFNDARKVDVAIKILKHEQGIELVPDSKWKVGSYKVRVDNRLEDVSGNSLGRAFEVDSGNTDQKTEAAFSTIPYSISD